MSRYYEAPHATARVAGPLHLIGVLSVVIGSREGWPVRKPLPLKCEKIRIVSPEHLGGGLQLVFRVSVLATEVLERGTLLQGNIMSQRKRAREWTERQVTDLLRGRILSGIHGGHLEAGDRLSTYREISKETGLDLRAVARVYGALAGEGLVEIRGKTGVFVAPQERLGGRVLEETARWMVGVLRDAWTRQIQLPHVPDFVRECIATVEVTCACIESTEDQIQSICSELHRDFGFRSLPVHADRLTPIQVGSTLHERFPAEVREADILVTTAFHASAIRPLADALEKPLMVVRLDPNIVRQLERIVEQGELTVVCVDPRFLERVRLVIGGEHGERIRGVLVDDGDAIRALNRETPTLVSHAARERLGDLDLPSVIPTGRVLSPDSAEDLAELLIRFNAEAMKEQ